MLGNDRQLELGRQEAVTQAGLEKLKAALPGCRIEWEDDATRARWLAQVVQPLREQQARQRDAASRAAASSRVDFFTMVRGET